MLGVIGIKVAILSPDAKIHDQINVNQELIENIKKNIPSVAEEKTAENKTTKRKRNKK